MLKVESSGQPQETTKLERQSERKKRGYSISLCIALMSVMGCNEIRLPDTSDLPWSKPKQTQTSNYTGSDIEDANCLSIRYDSRSVCRMQVHLNSLGYKVGKPDGIAGQATKSAIKKFQNRYKMNPADGNPSYEVLTKLRLKNSGQVNPAKTAVIAGTACAILAKLLKKDVEGAAVLCGLGGAIFQSISNKSKQKYALNYYEIKDENERSEVEIAQLSKQVSQNNSQIRSYQSQIQSLVATEKNDKAFISKASKLSKQIEQQTVANRNAKEEAEIKIAILEDQIEDVNALLAEKPNEKDFKMTMVSLEKKKSSLIQTINQSNGLERELLAQKSTLDSEIAKRS